MLCSATLTAIIVFMFCRFRFNHFDYPSAIGAILIHSFSPCQTLAFDTAKSSFYVRCLEVFLTCFAFLFMFLSSFLPAFLAFILIAIFHLFRFRKMVD